MELAPKVPIVKKGTIWKIETSQGDFTFRMKKDVFATGNWKGNPICHIYVDDPVLEDDDDLQRFILYNFKSEGEFIVLGASNQPFFGVCVEGGYVGDPEYKMIKVDNVQQVSPQTQERLRRLGVASYLKEEGIAS